MNFMKDWGTLWKLGVSDDISAYESIPNDYWDEMESKQVKGSISDFTNFKLNYESYLWIQQNVNTNQTNPGQSLVYVWKTCRQGYTCNSMRIWIFNLKLKVKAKKLQISHPKEISQTITTYIDLKTLWLKHKGVILNDQ